MITVAAGVTFEWLAFSSTSCRRALAKMLMLYPFSALCGAEWGPWGPHQLCSVVCEAVSKTILPRLCGVPASISWAARISLKGSRVPTRGANSPLLKKAEILFKRSAVTST